MIHCKGKEGGKVREGELKSHSYYIGTNRRPFLPLLGGHERKKRRCPLSTKNRVTRNWRGERMRAKDRERELPLVVKKKTTREGGTF